MAFISRPWPSKTKHAKKTWLSFLRRMECIWQTSKIRGKMEKLQISDPTIISSWLFLPVYPMSNPFKYHVVFLSSTMALLDSFWETTRRNRRLPLPPSKMAGLFKTAMCRRSTWSPHGMPRRRPRERERAVKCMEYHDSYPITCITYYIYIHIMWLYMHTYAVYLHQLYMYCI